MNQMKRKHGPWRERIVIVAGTLLSYLLIVLVLQFLLLRPAVPFIYVGF